MNISFFFDYFETFSAPTADTFFTGSFNIGIVSNPFNTLITIYKTFISAQMIVSFYPYSL